MRGSSSAADGRLLTRGEDLGVARTRRADAEALDDAERWDDVEPWRGADRDSVTAVRPAGLGHLGASGHVDLPNLASHDEPEVAPLGPGGQHDAGKPEHREPELMLTVAVSGNECSSANSWL